MILNGKMSPKSEKSVDFQFSYSVPKGKTINITIPLELPLPGLPTDYAEFHIQKSRIPCFAEESFRKEFLQFLVVEKDKISEDLGDQSVINLDDALEELADVWESNSRVSTPVSTDNLKLEEEFGQVCHKLYHSPMLPAMRAEENKAALELRDLVKRRNEEIKKIQEHHVMAMEGYINNGVNVDTTAVNDLAASQIEQRQNCEVKWASEISHLLEKQRKEFYSWVMQTYEDSLGGTEYCSTVPSTNSYFPEPLNSDPKLEESFSICIGSQLKITHSMRLFVDSVWNLCSGHPQAPERLQTALSLYTNSLSGLILLVDNKLNLYSGNTRKLSKICEVSPEFHFPPFDQQLTTIHHKLMNPDVTRRRLPTNCLIDDTVPNSVVKEDKSSGDLILPTGTCYITRHSNLKQVHTVFHLVSTTHEVQKDINSRDPLLSGLKSALRIAFENRVNNLVIPLFLTHCLESNMDYAWCIKRAEIVFKCVKGFMVEIGSAGLSTSKTFQFILPETISQKTFQGVSSLLPSIFRIPCPVVLDVGSRKQTLTVHDLAKLVISSKNSSG